MSICVENQYLNLNNEVPFETLAGKIFCSIQKVKEEEKEEEESGDRIIFKESDGEMFVLAHLPDCCESVYIDDICGDLDDIVDSPILLASEISNEDYCHIKNSEYDESYTWTFYKLSTNKGSVTIRWYGTSNGYYSERVGLYQVPGGRQKD